MQLNHVISRQGHLSLKKSEILEFALKNGILGFFGICTEKLKFFSTRVRGSEILVFFGICTETSMDLCGPNLKELE